MKLKTRMTLITTLLLTACCLMLYLWNMISTGTMMDNIRLLEPPQTAGEEARYARLIALDQQESRNEARLLTGLGIVVLAGCVLAYFSASLAMKPRT